MFTVRNIPFLRILIPFLIGIILYKFIASPTPLLFVSISLIGLLVAIMFRFLSYNVKKNFYLLNAVSIHLVLTGLGYLCVFIHKVENKPHWYKNKINAHTNLHAEICTPLKETERTYKANANILAIYEGKQKVKTTGETILYFKKGDSIPNLQEGDQILLVNKLNPVIAKGNPGEFNYSNFCKNKGVYDQAFLTPNEWSKIINLPTTSFNPFKKWHQQIKKILAQYIPNKTSLGIAQALLTGYRDDIDQEVYSEYTKTGLVHLLAISGLHMGIFYLGAQYFLGLLPLFKKRKKLLIPTALIIMWCFALITTFPPSVQRASVMFTFLGIGQLIYRKIPSINFLLASAFFLLLLQPHLLWEVGFQLSYAAVLGILLFYKHIRSRWHPKNFLTKKVWDIMCVSLTAQIFTFPIALYYFHQIPTLFLFTNVIAIPAVTLIIYGEVLLILLSFLPPVAELIGCAISNIIKGLNSFIHYTSNISFVSIQNVHISLSQCLLLLVLPAILAAWLLGKKKIFVPIALSVLLILFGTSIGKKYTQLSQSQLIVYNSNHSYIELIKGDKYISPDGAPVQDSSKFEKYIRQPSHLLFGVKQNIPSNENWNTSERYDLGSLGGKTILRIKKAYKLKISEPLGVDYLILSDKWIKNPMDIVNQVQPKEIIIDGNIPMWKIDELKSQLSEVDLPTHYITAEGAKIIPL